MKSQITAITHLSLSLLHKSFTTKQRIWPSRLPLDTCTRSCGAHSELTSPQKKFSHRQIHTFSGYEKVVKKALLAELVQVKEEVEVNLVPRSYSVQCWVVGDRGSRLRRSLW